MREKLVDHLRKFPTAPFLFVGSGVSQRYIKTETWRDLLVKFCAKTPFPYDYYRATAGSSLPKVATEISRQFHEIWWKSNEFAASRAAMAHIADSPESALKIEISNYILEASFNQPSSPELAEEIEALRKSVVDGIITTNWDTFLEQAFPEFHKYVGQDQLLFSDALGVGEIYKIHGCATQPTSLVLTENDYDVFTQRNAYLAAKLLTIFVEHPVIFLGYSLTDENVSQILRSIGACLTSSNIEKLRDRLIFVNWNRDQQIPEISNANIIIPGGYNVPVIEIKTASFLPIFEALGGLPRMFPARVLRRLKEHVYTLVRNNDPKGRLYVKDIDEAGDDEEDIEIVFGVGAISAIKDVGYRGVTRNDLLEDILDETKGYDVTKVVDEALPRLLRHNKYLPIFRYLRLAGVLNSSGAIETKNTLDARIIKATQNDLSTFAPPQQYKAKAAVLIDKYKSFYAFSEEFPADEVVMYATGFPEHAFDLSCLRDFLVKNRDLLKGANALIQTQYIKLICAYDWLANAREK